MIENRSMPPGIIIPELAYVEVRAAAAWLCTVFGFTERLRIGNHRVQLCLGEESIVVVELTASAIRPLQGWFGHSLMVRVADVDGHYERIKQQGVRILNPPETYPFGERQYTVEDIGGHRWTFTQSVADVAPEAWGGEWPGG